VCSVRPRQLDFSLQNILPCNNSGQSIAVVN